MREGEVREVIEVRVRVRLIEKGAGGAGGEGWMMNVRRKRYHWRVGCYDKVSVGQEG